MSLLPVFIILIKRFIKTSARVDNSLLPFGDGLERFEHYHIILKMI